MALITVMQFLYSRVMWRWFRKDFDKQMGGADSIDELLVKFELMINQSSEFSWALNKNFMCTYVSPSVKKVLGYTAKEFEEIPWEAFISREVIEIFNEAIQLQPSEKSGLEQKRWDGQFNHKNGHAIWLETLIKPITDGQGNFDGFMGISRDITARKELEINCSENHRTFKLLEEIDNVIAKGASFPEVMKKIADAFKEVSHASNIALFQYHKYVNLLECIHYQFNEHTKSYIRNIAGVDYKGIYPVMKKGTCYYDALMHGVSCYKTGKNEILSSFKSWQGFDYLTELIEPMIREQAVKQLGIVPIYTKGDPVGLLLFSTNEILTAQCRQRIDLFTHQVSLTLFKLNYEHALRESEEKFRNLADLSPAAISIHSASSYLYLNHSWEKLTGYSIAEGLRITPVDIAHPDVREEIQERSEKRLRGEKVPSRYELKIQTKSNTTKWVDVSFTLIEFEGINATLAIANDITKLKRTREKLKESERHFRELAELSPAAIVIFSKDKFYYVNQAWERMSGYSKEEALKFGILELLHPDMHEIILTRFNQRNAGEEVPDRYDVKVITKSGKVKWIDISITMINYEGKDLRLAVASDVTEQRKTEQMLKELNATKDKFFSIIAHDLKNPFNILLNAAQIFSQNFEDMTREERQMLLEQFHYTAQKTYDLVENLLVWARSQLKHIKVSQQKINIQQLVVESMELLRESATKKDIKLVSHIVDEQAVFADRNMILFVLRNLLSNAIKFTPQGGVVSITAKKQVEHHREWLEVAVTDTGVGIPQNKLEKLFRIDEAYSTPGTECEEGTGLGLILCNEFVKINGGRIQAESNLGEGSCFRFVLPSGE
ncbi:PAS domain S-box protein [Marinilabiliaceae bacterium JC017]|nr:PAS domain S-box protein [Marinilabiliaceae bacterium JC017]